MAAALVGAANAGSHHAHAHDLFHLARRNESVCVPGCTTVYTTVTGDFIWQPTPNAPPAQNSTSTSVTSTTSTVHLAQTTTKAVVPTPAAQTCETPGEYFAFPPSEYSC